MSSHASTPRSGTTSAGAMLRDGMVGRLLDGRYRVQEHIADGGMASVWLAVDERLDRDVAVKVMRRDLAADDAFVTRFRREARSAARLSHPHVVSVYDQGEDDGDMFLVMEYVPGLTLRELLQDGPLGPRAALDVFDPVLQALDAAHTAGLIHRDVKPENVIIRDDGAVKVADFGLARAVSAATTTNAAGTLMGTVAYLSPEQVERGIADARSDVYAAGLVLFEMLAGRKAFDGDTPIHVAYQHVHGSVPVASDLVPGVAPELDALVALGTARDPGQRPDGGGDYLVEVRRVARVLAARGAQTAHTTVLEAQPTSTTEVDLPSLGRPRRTVPTGPDSPSTSPQPASAARVDRESRSPESPEPELAEGGRRRRWPAVLVTLLVLVVAAGAVGGWWFRIGPGATTLVPTVNSLSQAAAEQALSAAGLKDTTTSAFSESVATGQVIGSDPAQGMTVHRDTTVGLVVSKGPERFAAPSLKGKSLQAAQAALDNVQLRLGDQTPVYSETVASGIVLDQDPAPGTALKRDEPVKVTVSKGRQPISVTSYEGQSADDATQKLTADGLQVVTGDPVNSDSVPAGSVVTQTPKDGTLYKGDKVTIVVSKGPELVAVPTVVGKQQAEAEQILKDAGFSVNVTKVLGGFFGTVRSSDPTAGTMARKGSTITLTIV